MPSYKEMQAMLKSIRAQCPTEYAAVKHLLPRGLASTKACLEDALATLEHNALVEVEAEWDEPTATEMECAAVEADEAIEAAGEGFEPEFLEATTRLLVATAVASTPAVKAHNAAAAKYWERADRLYAAYTTLEAAIEWLIETGLPRAAADSRILASAAWVAGLTAQELAQRGAADVRRVLADARLAHRSIRYAYSDLVAK